MQSFLVLQDECFRALNGLIVVYPAVTSLALRTSDTVLDKTVLSLKDELGKKDVDSVTWQKVNTRRGDKFLLVV